MGVFDSYDDPFKAYELFTDFFDEFSYDVELRDNLLFLVDDFVRSHKKVSELEAFLKDLTLKVEVDSVFEDASKGYAVSAYVPCDDYEGFCD